MISPLLALQKLKFEAKSLFARHPKLRLLHQPFVWWQQYKIWTRYPDESPSACVVGNHTEFVLDGFQGSANSYATDIFTKSQSQPVQIAHHLHSPAQVINGVKRGLPVLITIRAPVDACLSLTSRWPYVSMSQALRSYMGYYTALLPYADQIVWSPFHTTIHDLNRAIQSVNSRFDTSFEMTSSSAVDEIRQRHAPEKSHSEKQRRDLIKQEKLLELESTKNKRLAEEAHSLYQDLRPYFASDHPSSTEKRTAFPKRKPQKTEMGA